ncbi:hypothetical protein VTI74DRAFT_5660 [Chaetomium olivicolor]
MQRLPSSVSHRHRLANVMLPGWPSSKDDESLEWETTNTPAPGFFLSHCGCRLEDVVRADWAMEEQVCPTTHRKLARKIELNPKGHQSPRGAAIKTPRFTSQSPWLCSRFPWAFDDEGMWKRKPVKRAGRLVEALDGQAAASSSCHAKIRLRGRLGWSLRRVSGRGNIEDRCREVDLSRRARAHRPGRKTPCQTASG